MLNFLSVSQLLKKPEKADESEAEKPKEKVKKAEREKLKEDRAPGSSDSKKRHNGENREDRPRKWALKGSYTLP